MKRLKRIVTQIAFTPDCRLSALPLLHRSLLPLLSLGSSLYRLSLSLRRLLHHWGLLHPRRLPVPVISVGNLTWGGNGKTPMAEFIARLLDESGIGPLILTRHWNLLRDVEIVMLNGVMPWGNNHLLPLGPLREPVSALVRADIVVIHHADLVPDTQLRMIESTVQNIVATLPIFYSRMAASHFFEVKNPHSRLPLSTVQNMVVLCVSAIGFPDAFAQAVSKIGPLHVDRLDFSDHHLIQANDIDMIRERLRKLKHEFNVEAIVVVTEKDYDRDPIILKELQCVKVLVLCSSLHIMETGTRTEENFRMSLKKHLIDSLQEKKSRCRERA